MCQYPHSHGHVLVLGKCVGEVGCCTENGNAVLCYFFEYDSGFKYSSNRNILCFFSQNCLEKTVPAFYAELHFWGEALVQAYISYNHMSTLALSLNVSV